MRYFWIFLAFLLLVFLWLLYDRKELPTPSETQESTAERSRSTHEPVETKSSPAKTPQTIQTSPIEAELRSTTNGKPDIVPSNSEKLPPIQVTPLRDKEGKLLLMNQAKAIKSCAEQNLRLPTARELAQIIQVRGGKGILDEKKTEQREIPEGYGRVMAVNSDGTKDDFYYSNEGYVAPPGDIGDLKKYRFLSSSVDDDPEFRADPPCILGLWNDRYGKGFISCTGHFGPNGNVPDEYLENHSAVLCVGKK